MPDKMCGLTLYPAYTDIFMENPNESKGYLAANARKTSSRVGSAFLKPGCNSPGCICPDSVIWDFKPSAFTSEEVIIRK
jgi:hypothetical protein